MEPSRNAPVVARAGLLAHAVVRLSIEEATAMRRAPLRACGDAFAVSSLKHFDEQTLPVLAALQRAIRDANLLPDPEAQPFHDWGILAAPRYIARAPMMSSMSRFHVEGAWGVSPHMIPYRSLHSVSGTISQFLQAHGPNHGVGGGPGGVAELLLAGMSLLTAARLPGLWLAASRIEPDRGLDDNGRPPPGSMCEAIVLALVPEAMGAPFTLEYEPAPAVGFDDLAQMLESLRNQPSACFADNGRLTIRQARAVAGPHLAFSLTRRRAGLER